MESKTKKDLRSPLAKARDEWFESEEGQRCLGDSILYNDRQVKYLRNRLEGAFLAGAKAAEIDLLTRLTAAGCELPDSNDDLSCFYCHAYLQGGEPHEKDCPYMEALSVLGINNRKDAQPE